MLRRSWLLGSLVLGTCAGAGSPLAAQVPAARVEHQGPERRDLETSTATIVFRVTGTGSRATAWQEVVELPPGWRLITPGAPFTLAPGASDLRLVGVAVPAGAAAGVYRLRYRIHPVQTGVTSGTIGQAGDSVLLVLPRRRALALRVVRTPDFVAAGRGYVAEFLLTNRGNTPATTQLTVESGSGFAARPDAVQVELAPGEARTVSVAVETSRRLSSRLRHRVTLRATDGVDTTARTSAVSLVEVIPRANAGARPRPGGSVPVRLALRGSRHGTAAPFKLSGGGALGPDGLSIAVSAHGAGAPDGLLPERDEYRLDLRSRSLDLTLGDQIYGLSPLTGPGRLGFGASGRVALGPVVARGFAQWDRRAAFRPEARGGFLGLRLGAPVEVGANLLERAPEQAPLWSLRARLFPAAGQTVDLEYGLGTAQPGDAYAVALRGSRPRWAYELRRLRTDSAFQAPFGVAAQDYASVGVRPWRQLHLEASASAVDRSRGGIGAGTGAWLLGPREERLYRAALGYGGTTAEYRRREARPTGVPTAGLRTAESARLKLGLRDRRSWLQPYAEFGYNSLEGIADRAPFRRLGLLAGLRDGHGSSVDVTVEGYRSRRVGSTAEDDRLTATVNASLLLSGTTRVRLLSQGARIDGLGRQWTGLLDATLEQTLPFGHTIAARARLFELRGTMRRSQSALVLEYALPLRVPLSRPASTTGLSGRVYDAETRRGVANAVVRVGQQVVVTDRSGRWAIEDLAPGPYQVVLDQRSLPSAQVPLATAPVEARIAPGQRSRLELGVTRSARLSGSVIRFDLDSSAANLVAGTAAIAERGGAPGLVVELTSAGRVVRRVTDAAGEFEIRDLPAGEWRVRISGELPAHYYLERDTVSLQLVAGQSATLHLRMLPRVRRVQMLTAGEVTLGPRPAPGSARPAPAGAPTSGGRASTTSSPVGIRHRYTVTRYDVSLMYVARFMYGDAAMWPKIWIANRHQLPSPDLIRPGQVLLIPDPGPLTPEEFRAASEYQAAIRSNGKVR